MGGLALPQLGTAIGMVHHQPPLGQAHETLDPEDLPGQLLQELLQALTLQGMGTLEAEGQETVVALAVVIGLVRRVGQARQVLGRPARIDFEEE